MYEYTAKCIRVIDGDTVEILIDLGCDVFKKETIRLYGINAPEKKGDTKQAAINSTIYLHHQLMEEFLIRTIKDKGDKYGRLLGILVKININKEKLLQYYSNEELFKISINQEMINSNHAVYAPKSWK